MHKALIPFLFIFIFIFLSVPAMAYYPIDLSYNETISGDAHGLRVINSTADNKVYVYFADDNFLYRYNSTFGDKKSCSLSAIRDTMLLINETTLYAGSGATCYQYNITDIVNGNCVLLKENTTGWADKCDNTNSYSYGTFSENDAYYYHGIYDRFLNPLEASYWSNVYIKNNSVSIPDRTDNSTLYMTYTGYPNAHGKFYKYVNKAYVDELGSPSEIWGIAGTYGEHVFSDIIEIGTITYAFISEQGSIYKVNMGYASNYSDASFYPIEPLNETISLTPTDEYYNLILYLDTEYDGTLYFYHDDAYITEIKINGTNINQHQFSTAISFDGTEAAHSWNAYFVDNQSIQWSFGSGKQYYTITTGLDINDFFTNPAETLSLWIGRFFDDGADQDTSNEVSGLLFTLVGALAITIFCAKNGMKNNMAFVFIASMLMFIMLFATLGWIDPIITVIIVILLALIMAKMLNIFGG